MSGAGATQGRAYWGMQFAHLGIGLGVVLLAQGLVVVLNGFKNVWAGQELNHGSVQICLFAFNQGSVRNTDAIRLSPVVTLASYGNAQLG